MTAKRLEDECRANGCNSSFGSATVCFAEQRWKWVENYCWNNACLRNQNQCNDKWDNLLHDYKKVCNYEARSMVSVVDSAVRDRPFYWAMEWHQWNSKR
ncbi:putative trihelix transcription factor ASR3 [Cocos nucifera]|uniref:Putative trihelix transcription factor ASR3 n=1 Tax=Cocos nucifera TaxID=13894 RepID=A0A8K0MW64_COCNU|nr:putative trihelix transcription factor ASR3 [Cocos nucifera]